MILTPRFVAIAALGALFAAPVAAKVNKEALCNDFGTASSVIAQMRRDGTSETDAQIAFVKDYEDSILLQMQLVPWVSSYVYGLNEEQLSGDVETPFVEQCLAHLG